MPGATKSRDEALAASPRLVVDTESLSGSISLKGARIDDLRLKKYHETVDPKSPTIELLSPSGAPHPFYAEIGFVPAAGEKPDLPGPDTLWTADGTKLTATTPVTLTFDNGKGLVFKRRISVDNDYLFTVQDSVENKTDKSVTLYPFSLVSRHGKPETSGYSVLHEGLIGVVGDSGVQEYAYDKIEKETNGQKGFKGVGGWVGFTDKYWAATVAPDQTQARSMRRLSGGGRDRRRPIRPMRWARLKRSSPARPARPRPMSSPAPRSRSFSTATSRRRASRNSTC